MKWLKEIWCGFITGHSGRVWVRNIYGDEINLRDGKRSVWQCRRCGACPIYRAELVENGLVVNN